MTAADLLALIETSGAWLRLTPNGTLRLTGSGVDRWLPVLGQYHEQLTDALRADGHQQESER